MPTVKNRRATAPTPAPRRHFCDVATAAEFHGVDPRTIRRWCADGKLTAYRTGGTLLRLDWADVEALAVQVDPSDVSR